MAVENTHTELALVLIDYNANYSLRDITGLAAIDIARQKNLVAVVHTLEVRMGPNGAYSLYFINNLNNKIIK